MHGCYASLGHEHQDKALHVQLYQCIARFYCTISKWQRLRESSGESCSAMERTALWLAGGPMRDAPVLRNGKSQALPRKGPAARGWEERRMSTAATISLSATGSRKAPKSLLAFC